MASQCARKLVEICLPDITHDLLTSIRQELKAAAKPKPGTEKEVECLILKCARALFTDSLKDDTIKKQVVKLLRTKHIEVFEAAIMLRENALMMQIVLERNIYFINRLENQFLSIELMDPMCRLTFNKKIIIEMQNPTGDRWAVHFGKFAVKHRVSRIRFSIKDSDLDPEERQDRLDDLVMKVRQLDCRTANRTAGYLRRSFHFPRETHIFLTQHDDLEDMPASSKRNSMEVIFRIKD